MLALSPLACGLTGYQPSRLGPTHTSRGRVALSATPPNVLCVGECLFDALPSGIFLGGAPLNVACHLAELGAQASFASAVGDDRLGREALRRLRARGVDVDLVATDPTAETGFVTAEVDTAGDATYTFATPAAWDNVPEDGLAAAAAAADAVVFGTLAQRSGVTRAAVQAACKAARFPVLDVNLRPPYDSAELVGSAVAGGVSLLKLNDEELVPVADALHAHYAAMPEAPAELIASANTARSAAAAALRSSNRPSTTLRIGRPRRRCSRRG